MNRIPVAIGLGLAAAIALAACSSHGPAVLTADPEAPPAASTAEAAGSGVSSTSNSPVFAKVPRWILAVDETGSTSVRHDDVAADVIREITASYQQLGGAGTYLSVVSFGGGPGDVRSIDDTQLCRDGARQCGDPVALARRYEPTIARARELLARAPAIGGSDPIGYLYQALAQTRVGYPENDIRIVIWTDLVSRSDTLPLDGSTDISTPQARTAVITRLADRGLDFSTLDLTGVTIQIRLVPTDTASVSSVYAGYLRSLVMEMLEPTAADLSFTTFTATDI